MKAHIEITLDIVTPKTAAQMLEHVQSHAMYLDGPGGPWDGGDIVDAITGDQIGTWKIVDEDKEQS